MRQKISDQDILLGEDIRVIRRLWKVDKTQNSPEGLEFAYQYLYFNGDRWMQIARIDNQMHKGKPGVHIHELGKEVAWQDMDFEEAFDAIVAIGEKFVSSIR